VTQWFVGAGQGQLSRSGYRDSGNAITALSNDLPIFWARRVTPQAVIAAAEPPFVFIRAPGCVTGLMNRQFAILQSTQRHEPCSATGQMVRRFHA
jgi:Protein of unknown function (DUF1445)